ncbi:MAG: metal ABC transporter permease [Chloroflexi bacterium]|nr:metal ABC transporter permease [Chloroflexota bacterium]
MQRALVAVVMVGIISGVVGCYVVIRGMSFFGDALSHSILPGVAISYIATGGASGANLFFGGLIAGIISALGIGWLTRGERLKEDTAIGIVFVAMYALGIAIISHDARAYGRDLVHILFGNVLGIQGEDLLIMAVCGVLVLGGTLFFYKELQIISFDLNLARSLRLPAETLRLILLAFIAVTIIASLRVVGIALMLAMLIVPAATAQILAKRLHHMMLISAGLGALGGVVGLLLSYYLDIAAGPSIVLTMTAVFALVFTASRLYLRLRTPAR